MLEHDGRSLKLVAAADRRLSGRERADRGGPRRWRPAATWTATFSAMQRVAPVRGRLERAVISRAGVPVYVDYAHTPDALEAAIAALRPHVDGPADHRVRRRRRPRPGQAARDGRGRRRGCPTSSSSPTTIRAARIRRRSARRSWRARLARPKSPAAARRSPKRSASPRAGDIVLLAGKGHETGQIIGDRVLPFDDALVARECAA